MSLKPLHDRVIVKADEAEEKTASGLILADSAKEKPTRGKVIAVGEGKYSDAGVRVPMEVKVGDVVIYSKYGATEVKDGAEELLILRDTDIYAIIAS